MIVSVLVCADGYTAVSGTVDAQSLVQLVERLRHTYAWIFWERLRPDLELPVCRLIAVTNRSHKGCVRHWSERDRRPMPKLGCISG